MTPQEDKYFFALIKKYNILLDNENYDDLESFVKEFLLNQQNKIANYLESECLNLNIKQFAQSNGLRVLTDSAQAIRRGEFNK